MMDLSGHNPTVTTRSIYLYCLCLWQSLEFLAHWPTRGVARSLLLGQLKGKQGEGAGSQRRPRGSHGRMRSGRGGCAAGRHSVRSQGPETNSPSPNSASPGHMWILKPPARTEAMAYAPVLALCRPCWALLSFVVEYNWEQWVPEFSCLPGKSDRVME